MRSPEQFKADERDESEHGQGHGHRQPFEGAVAKLASGIFLCVSIQIFLRSKNQTDEEREELRSSSGSRP
jgi:hypothetical protein